jgi:hypothetical protein
MSDYFNRLEKQTFPAEVVEAVKVLLKYGQAWVDANCAAEPVPAVTEPESELRFIPGLMTSYLDSQHGEVVFAAWEGKAVEARKLNGVRFFNYESLIRADSFAKSILLPMWKQVHSKGPATEPLGYRGLVHSCRVYVDTNAYLLARKGVVVVVPRVGSRVDIFSQADFQNSWLFEGGSLPSNVTNNPAAMAAFTHAGLV